MQAPRLEGNLAFGLQNHGYVDEAAPQASACPEKEVLTGMKRTTSLAAARIPERLITDHEAVMRWVRARGGEPARALHSRDGATDLRIRFADEGADEELAVISWREFFRRFEAEALALLSQEGSGVRARLVYRPLETVPSPPRPPGRPHPSRAPGAGAGFSLLR